MLAIIYSAKIFYMFFHYWALVSTVLMQTALLVASISTWDGGSVSSSLDKLYAYSVELAVPCQLVATGFFWAFLQKDAVTGETLIV